MSILYKMRPLALAAIAAVLLCAASGCEDDQEERDCAGYEADVDECYVVPKCEDYTDDEWDCIQENCDRLADWDNCHDWRCCVGECGGATC